MLSLKNVSSAVSAGAVANPAVVMVSVGMLREVEFYLVNTDVWSDAHSETSQWVYTKYKHFLNAA